MTATTLFVVPKSIPIIFAIFIYAPNNGFQILALRSKKTFASVCHTSMSSILTYSRANISYIVCISVLFEFPASPAILGQRVVI